MQAVATYDPDYVAQCRSAINDRISAYRAVIVALRGSPVTLQKKLSRLEASYFNDLVVFMEGQFAQRLRSKEGKDANALTETRMVATSLLHHDGYATIERGLHYDQSQSVLGLAEGQPINLSLSQFSSLADAFFRELEDRYC